MKSTQDPRQGGLSAVQVQAAERRLEVAAWQVIEDNLVDALLTLYFVPAGSPGYFDSSGRRDVILTILEDFGAPADEFLVRAQGRADALLAAGEATEYLERRERLAAV
jgi:hypothetical protein